ncbi:hypothetical protein G5V58_11175 [Nocardioides anomalus]|uniref:Glycosyl hydrolase family 67 C-terminal domain-containing protein n=1 Tax=Nocardioides anomalus TaxID=2712223 RepID=A0A6G6WDC3_9ACTN|nr:hypothetical protein [Nocardioides anomalus]QIG43242.1 hypothetical protein G5V58_11175 [Nocardioides anomalus]
MATTRRQRVLAPWVAVLLLALGAGVAAGVGQLLGISTEPAAQMTPPDPVVPEVGPVATNPRLEVTAPNTVRFGVALDELRAAQGATTPSGTASVTVTVGAGEESDDGYRLGGTPDALTVDAASETGGVRAVYDLAQQVRAGRPVAEHLGGEVRSALPFRMVDLGAVGVTPDPDQWRPGNDYSHVSRAFEDAYLEHAPYVDADALADDYGEWDAFLRHVLADGYDAVAWPGFVEYADLPAASAEDRERAAALRAAFEPFWDRAHELGMKVFLRTDMLALTPELADDLEQRFGTDTEDPALWRVYTDALQRLYDEAPGLSGVLLRIGEAGSIYAEPGFDQYSALAVRTVRAVRTMLTAFTDQAEASGREVVFRTWSVGIGAVGDMHTDPASYHRVLDGLDSPALIVSTKYTAGDFYSWLPLNTTLETGDQRRIVEFQSRREFEGFGAFPDDLGPEFSWAVQRLVAANPHVEGVWSWTQDGGPWRAGPMSLYLTSGFWPLYEANTLTAAAVARDPGADVGGVTVDWARRYLSDDPATVRAVAEAMALSRDAIHTGLYLRPFAEQRVVALGLEPPPQMWLFEWDVLTGDSATLDLLYAVVRDRLDETLADGERAVATAERMRALVVGTDPDSWRPGTYEAFTGALDYEVDTLRLLAAYRTMFLRAAAWHDTGEGHRAWVEARDAFDRAAAAHLAAPGGDVQHPAWNLTAARLGVERADRDLAMAWTARVLLVLALLWLLLSRATRVAITRPWAARTSVPAIVVGGLLFLATRCVQTSFLAPAHLLVTLGALALSTVLLLLLGGRRAAGPVLTVVSSVCVVRAVVTLAALAPTGPGGYWFAFWTEPARRSVYVTVAVALFLWLFVAAGWALAGALGARRAAGAVLAGVGLGLGAAGLFVAAYGLERGLTVWNDQLGLLPWGLARILGLTTYLEIPADAAWWAAGAGGAVLAVGLLLRLTPRRRPATS